MVRLKCAASMLHSALAAARGPGARASAALRARAIPDASCSPCRLPAAAGAGPHALRRLPGGWNARGSGGDRRHSSGEHGRAGKAGAGGDTFGWAGAAACGVAGLGLWLTFEGDALVARAELVPRRFLTTIDFHAPVTPVPSKIYPYVIIAHPRAIVAQAALETLTKCDPESEVLVVADRYNFDDQFGSRLYAGYFGNPVKEDTSSRGRQMITAFTTGTGKSDDDMSLQPTPSVTDKKNVHMCTDAHVTHLDVENKLVTLSDGRTLGFGKVLLATGCREAVLPGVPDTLKHHVTNLRKVKDFDRVQKMAKTGEAKRIVVVGGGFLGCEVASQLQEAGKANGVEVVHCYVEPGALYRYVPVYFADYMTERLRQLGVVEKPYHMVLQIREPDNKANKNNRLNLVLQGFEQTSLDCSHVVFAPTHLEGNVDLAQQSGLEIDKRCGGVMVNAEMMARSDVYVAGDTASYPDKILGRRRMQSYDHSYHSGVLAAMNMALKQRQPYNHLPVITSHGGPLGMDVVVLGDIDSTMEMYSIVQLAAGNRFDPMTTSDSETPSTAPPVAPWGVWEKGVVWYLKDKRVVGAMLLNLTDMKDQVRELIRNRLTYQCRVQAADGSQRIQDLEHCLDLSLSNPVCRHSSARGQGIMRNQSGKGQKGTSSK